MEYTVNEITVFVLYAIYIILQIIVGFFLLYKTYKTRIYNLSALVSYFFINSIKFFLLIIDAPFLAFHYTIPSDHRSRTKRKVFLFFC